MGNSSSKVVASTTTQSVSSKFEGDKAILRYQNAVKITPDNHPHKPSHLINLGNSLITRFERLGSLEDLESAISNYREAVKLTPDGHVEKPGRLNNLGGGLRARFERLGRLEDLESAISSHQSAVDLTPNGHPGKPGRLSNLGIVYRVRFERFGNLQDLENAVSNYQEAIDLTPDGQTAKPGRLNSLGIGFITLFERLGNLEDLENAILTCQAAVKLTPNGHPDKPIYLNSLGGVLNTRFRRLGSLKDLEDAISSLQTAVDITPNGHPNKPGRLNGLGNGIRARFQQSGNHKDLEAAIWVYQTAVDLTPNGHPDKPFYLNNLGFGFRLRFEHLGSLEDLESAVSSYRKAVELMPEGHTGKPTSLGNLGTGLEARFERLGRLEDLDSAILSYQKAVELTPNGHIDKPRYLSNLGGGLNTRFRRLGTLEDLESAISNHQSAVDLTPNGPTDKPNRLNNLGTSLLAHFEWLGSLKDLENAISSFQTAVDLTPAGHPDRPNRLNNLGIGLRARFERLGALNDLESAISSHQEAAELTPDGHTDKPGRLDDLGIGLRARFKSLGRLEDLESAISSHQSAVDLIPDGHPGKPRHLSNLANNLFMHFDRFGSLEVLESTISNYQTAVDLTPDGHRDRPVFVLNLGDALISRSKYLNDQKDLGTALSNFEQAANSPTGSPRIRFKAAKRWAECGAILLVSPISAYQCAIDLLPRIAWLGIPVHDQHALLADVGAVVRDAVKAAIMHEKYETAVEWAEQGRSIVWQNLLGLRTPLDKLRVDNPQLASRLQVLSRQLEAPSITSSQIRPMSNEDPTQTYSQLAIEWDKTVGQVRRIPGFETFLRAKGFSELAPVAREGPVVILNDHSFGGDALALIPDSLSERHVSVINIPLEGFTSDLGKNLFLDLKGVLSKAGVRSRNIRKSKRVESESTEHFTFSEILRELWLKVVKPVIDGLASQDKKASLSRIWWCATGSLAFLPIHAAGLYGAGEAEENISDYFISSYTPTLTAMLDQSNPVIPEEFRILAVAEPSISNPIPKTEDEVRLIKNLSGGLHVTDLMNEKATVNIVLQEMMKSHWIHLACHGQQHIDDPMQSGFLLHGGNTLTLSEIVRQTLPKADFAFLSACQTAMGDEKVAEESVHLAAGMLLSGCRGVIATMWSIGDDDAPKVAEDVYKRILKDGKPNREGAALALHEATKRLRKEAGADFISWVPFIHIGR